MQATSQYCAMWTPKKCLHDFCTIYVLTDDADYAQHVLGNLYTLDPARCPPPLKTKLRISDIEAKFMKKEGVDNLRALNYGVLRDMRKHIARIGRNWIRHWHQAMQKDNRSYSSNADRINALDEVFSSHNNSAVSNVVVGGAIGPAAATTAAANTTTDNTRTSAACHGGEVTDAQGVALPTEGTGESVSNPLSVPEVSDNCFEGGYALPYVEEPAVDILRMSPQQYMQVKKRINSRCDNINCQIYRGDDHRPKKCGRCQVASYCCRECQAADWPTHKAECQQWSKELLSKAALEGVAPGAT
jgi:MYND finger